MTRRRLVDPELSENAKRTLRRAVMLYIDLWILEGAARKWIAPLSDVGYFARDALAICILVFLAFNMIARRRSAAWFWTALFLLVVFGIVQVMLGIVDTPVMLVGLRAYAALAFFPAIVWQCRHLVTLETLSSRILFYLPLQAVLTIGQVASPPSAFINITNGNESASFVNFGIVRATGTFSAVSGLGGYLGITIAIALVGLMSRDRRQTARCTRAAVLTLFCALLGGDRSTLLTVAIIGIAFFLMVVLMIHSSQVGQALPRFGLLATLSIATLGLVFYRFSGVLDSFTQRFESASRSEDSSARVVDQTFGFAQQETFPGSIYWLFGDGMGAHTQAGIALGSPTYWIEVEASRWVGELGLVGLVIAWVRVVIAILLVIKALSSLKSGSPSLAIFILLFVTVLLPGLITQTPSTQAAFGVMIVLIQLAWNEGADSNARIIGKRSMRHPELKRRSPA